MKKSNVITFLLCAVASTLIAQEPSTQLQAAVRQVETASTDKEYEKLAKEFSQIASASSGQWLPNYYAAYCNARIGWLYQQDGERIEPYADKAEQQINQALAAIDSNTQHRELSEIYVVLSMINRARVFINPMTYGPKYGPAAHEYLVRARKLDLKNPRATYLEGWEKYSTPKMWGGDKTKAKALLETAASQVSAEKPTGGYPHWSRKETEALLKQIK